MPLAFPAPVGAVTTASSLTTLAASVVAAVVPVIVVVTSWITWLVVPALFMEQYVGGLLLSVGILVGDIKQGFHAGGWFPCEFIEELLITQPTFEVSDDDVVGDVSRLVLQLGETTYEAFETFVPSLLNSGQAALGSRA